MQTLLTVKKPSKILEKLTDKCVSEFGKLNKSVNAALEQGRIEGFQDREVGVMIRTKMIHAGYSRMTVSRYLPASAKNKPRGIQVSASAKVSNNLVQNRESEGEDKDKDSFTKQAAVKAASAISNKMLQTQTDDIEQFSMVDRHLYKPEFLGKVIDNLARIYNEKTGQKIIVIFRKMTDDSSSTTKDNNKKYQPTPDEVKQREEKVISLVDEGIVKISDLVEQSGVSDSATRRYLQKAGYRIMAGVVSH